MKSTRDLNRMLHRQLGRKKATTLKVQGQDSIAVGLDVEAEIVVDGDAGDYFGTLNNGASLMLKGSAGRFVGDVMRAGRLVVNGDCDEGAGMYMYGGQLLVNGNAGDCVGQISKGGTIVIKGTAGDFAGLYLTGGDIVVLKDVGDMTGDWMIRGRIFVGGIIASLGNNAVVEDLTDEDKHDLDDLSKRLGFAIPSDKLKKVVPKDQRPFYK